MRGQILAPSRPRVARPPRPSTPWTRPAPQPSEQPPRRALFPSPWLWPALALLVLYAVGYLGFAVQLVAFPFGMDQGEGYDTWSAWLMRLGQWPYADNAAYPYFSSNYPPLWSTLVAGVMIWLGPTLAAARIVSIVSALGAAGLVGLAAARYASLATSQRGRSALPVLAGLLGAGFFLASPYVFHTTPLARVNATTLLFALLALSLVEIPTRRRTVLGAVALLAALYVKPTALDALASTLLFLLLVQPRRAALATRLLLPAGLIGFALLELATHGALWLNLVVANANAFEPLQLVSYLANFTALHGMLLIFAGAEVMLAFRARAWSPWALFLPAALVMSLTVGKWGAGESYFLNAIAATSVLAAGFLARLLQLAGAAGPVRSEPLHEAESVPVPPAFRASFGVSSPFSSRLDRTGPRPLAVDPLPRWILPALGTALLTQTLFMAHGPLSALLPWLPDRGLQAAVLGRPPTPADWEAAHEIAAAVRDLPGPVLSEEPSIPLIAGGDIVGNATHLRNLYSVGRWDPGSLVADVRAHRFALVVLNAQLYPAPVLSAIGRSYYLDRSITVNGTTYSLFLPGGTSG